MPADPAPTDVLLVALEMGYGHVRAAAALADVLGTEILHADRPPVAVGAEAEQWSRARAAYEIVSRASHYPVLGRVARRALDALTDISNLYPYRDQSSPTVPVRLLRRSARRGLGRALLAELERRDATLVTTFYAPAVIADYGGWDRTVCVVTDTDLNRIWVPADPRASRIVYCAPSQWAVRRLRAYGVPKDRIRLTGFPLPPELVGGPDLDPLRTAVRRRLVRLDPTGVFRESYREELTHFIGPLPAAEERRAPLLTFAVGGAGAQVDIVRRFLPSLARTLGGGRLRVVLVAGTHADVAERFREWIALAGLREELEVGVIRILHEPDLPSYIAAFNRTLAETDILWTKPSEMTFFGALGLPLVFSRPVGTHERYNRRWAIQRGAGLEQGPSEHAGHWLGEWLEEGTLAAAAWSGYMRLPKFGSTRIAEVVARTAATAGRR